MEVKEKHEDIISTTIYEQEFYWLIVLYHIFKVKKNDFVYTILKNAAFYLIFEESRY